MGCVDMIKPESNCTVFKSNKKGGFDRYFVPQCHWQENKARNVLKSGMQNADSVTVYIPLGKTVILPDETTLPSDKLLPNTETVPNSAAKDIIIKGKCKFVFDNTNQQSVSESLRELQKNYDCHTVMSIDRKSYGRKGLQHIKISAR